MDADICSTCSGVRSAATRGVSVVIGEIELAVMLCGPSSHARKRVNWITPAFAWVDPKKDREAELIAVQNGFKSRSAVIESEGNDPEEVDAQIAADRAREQRLGLSFGAPAPAAATPAPDDGDDAARDDDVAPPADDGDAAPTPAEE